MHQHKHGRTKIETKNIRLAFILNFLFVIIEIIGGFWTNSVAILSDAVHDFGDSVSLGFSWYLQKIARRDNNDRFTYGYRRYSVLGAIINLMILLVSCIFILFESIPRLLDPQPVYSPGMLILSIIGIVINFLAMKSLQRGQSINERVVSLHFLEDVLGWVAVLIGSIAMMIWDIPIIDPILSILIACYILYNIVRNTITTMDVIMQRTPRNIDLEEIRKRVLTIQQIKDINDLHIWSLDGDYHVGSAIVYLKNDIDKNEIAIVLNQLHELFDEENISHVTFEPKFDNE